MRKLFSLMLVLVMAMAAIPGVYAETAFTMAGYDHEDTTTGQPTCFSSVCRNAAVFILT